MKIFFLLFTIILMPTNAFCENTKSIYENVLKWSDQLLRYEKIVQDYINKREETKEVLQQYKDISSESIFNQYKFTSLFSDLDRSAKNIITYSQENYQTTVTDYSVNFVYHSSETINLFVELFQEFINKIINFSSMKNGSTYFALSPVEINIISTINESYEPMLVKLKEIQDNLHLFAGSIKETFLSEYNGKNLEDILSSITEINISKILEECNDEVPISSEDLKNLVTILKNFFTKFFHNKDSFISINLITSEKSPSIFQECYEEIYSLLKKKESTKQVNILINILNNLRKFVLHVSNEHTYKTIEKHVQEWIEEIESVQEEFSVTTNSEEINERWGRLLEGNDSPGFVYDYFYCKKDTFGGLPEAEQKTYEACQNFDGIWNEVQNRLVRINGLIDRYTSIGRSF
jgi:hemerythrin-like domain-containing protein